MKKRFLSVILTIVMLVGILPGFAVTASASDGTTWDGTFVATDFAGGTGSEADPYIIETAGQLIYFRNQVSTSSNKFSGKYIRLDADINLADKTFGNPIGIGGKPFSGTFDGNNKTISGLKMIASSNSVGLFGYVTNATIKNLTIKDSAVSTTYKSSNVGGLIGSAYGCTIQNCHNINTSVTRTGNPTDLLGVGGLFGQVGKSGSGSTARATLIEGCTNSGTVSGYRYVGGIFGYVSSSVQVELCRNTGAVTASDVGAGGICGYDFSGSIITNCENTGSIKALYDAAGILGVSKNTKILNCLNAGSVTGTNEAVNAQLLYLGAGGIVGYADSYNNNATAITNCYNTGTVTAKLKAGGILGRQGNPGLTSNSVTNCYNYGNVTTTHIYSANYIGAIVGCGSNTSVQNCYYLSGSAKNAKNEEMLGFSNNSSSAINQNAHGKTADEFADGTVYELLQNANTEQVWGQTLGTDDYPVFYNGSNIPKFITTYTVTVENGTGSGEYEENATVTITADAPEGGMKFAGWTSDDGVTFADSKASTTTFTMPAYDVTVTATYTNLLPGKVIVNGIDLVNGDDDHAIDCGDGTAVYDPDTCTLTLTDAEITTPTSSNLNSCGIYASDLSGDFTIVLVGDNSIVLTDTAYDNTGIYKWGSTDLIIEGTGSLYIELFDDTSLQGIGGNNGNIIIKDATLEFAVTAGSKTSGDMIHTNKTITIDNANVFISEPKYYQAITSVGGITIKNCSVVNVTALENAIYSEGDIVIEDSTVTAEVPDFAAICGWGDIIIKDSAVTAHSEYDNGLYCYGEVIISGGDVTVTSDENDALRSNGGITVTDDAKVTAEGYGAGVYTNEILSIESGELTAKGENWAILARRIAENAADNEPTDNPTALILGNGLVEASGAVITTDDWVYTEVWDDWDWDYYDKWMSRSYFVNADGDRITEANIVRAYTVTWDNGDGDGYDQTIAPGKVITVPTSEYFTETFRKSGYTLIGWTGYTDGMTMPDTDVTFIAIYEADQYTVTFDTNGGEPIEPITVTYGEKYGRLPSSALMGFSGGDSNWYLVDENGDVTETKITNLSTVTTARDHTLKVVRKVLAPNLTIALTAPGCISDNYQYYNPEDSTRILTATLNNMNADLLDYTYKWYKDGVLIDGEDSSVLTLAGNVSDSGTYKVEVTAALKDGTSVTVSEDTATAEKEQTVTIRHLSNTLSYDANGGEDAPGNHYSGGASITVSSDLPQRIGCTFIGWNTKADGTGDSFDAGDSLTFTDDNGNGGCEVTLYAQWSSNKYTITFETNGGSAVAPITQDYASSVSAPKSPTKFAAEFAGWYADAELTTEYVFTTMPAKNITVYAKWNIDITPLVPILVRFDVNVADGIVGGNVTVDQNEASANSEVTITPDALDGYELSAVTVTDENGKSVEVTKNDDGTYTFTMPMRDVTVTAIFDKTEAEVEPTLPVDPIEPDETDDECKRDESCPLDDFTDLQTDAWYHDGVHYAIEKGLMCGMGDGIFAPDGKLSRAMLVTILWRLEGEPVVNYLMTFEDVEQDAWYGEAVRWAASEKIVEGYSAASFGPDDAITREQLAAILYRYEKHKGGGFKGLWMFRMDYTDLAELSDWACEAMCWCSMNGIVTGKPDKLLDPNGTATRAQAATMLCRYFEASSEEE